MDPASYIDPALTRPDLIVLRTLLHDISVQEGRAPAADDKSGFTPFLFSHFNPQAQHLPNYTIR